ncbi:Zn-ribbon domain-containing OB-fold protein [Yinghuangia aomiensis]
MRYQECEDCGRAILKPQDFCPNCLGIRLTWRESSGSGEVYSYLRRLAAADPRIRVPYVVATSPNSPRAIRCSPTW